MKKFYLFGTLLLAIIGIGVTRALVVQFDEILPEDLIEDGKIVSIGCEVSSYNNDPVKFENTDKLFDSGVVNDEGEYQLQQAGVANENIMARHAWKLEAGTEAGWYYIKNLETGRYWSYECRDNCDPSKPETLGNEDDDVQWWNEDGFANCNISITLVEDKADAKQFTFKSPEEGVKLINPNANTERYQHVIEAACERGCVMVMAKMSMAGKDYYAAVNDAVPGGMSRYTDWAAYMTATSLTLVDDPFEEFCLYMQNLPKDHYEICDDPGFVEQVEEAQAYNEIVEKYRDEIDYEHTTEYWRQALEELKAAVEKTKNFTYRPMVPGYYRFESSFEQYFLQQGTMKAMYVTEGKVKWGDEDKGNEITEDILDENGEPTGETKVLGHSGLNFVWEVYEEDGKFYVRNLESQQYFVATTGQSSAYQMSYSPEYIEFKHLGEHNDWNLKVGGKGYALHTEGHSGGSGKGGNLVGWNGGSNTGSSWYTRKVTKEEIIELWGTEVLDQAAIKSEFATLVSNAKQDVENARASGTQALITDVNQISSPKSEPTEGTLAALIDGDLNSYWHSQWSEGSVNDNPELLALHYLQFDLLDKYQKVEMRYANRPVSADRPTVFTIWASNDAEASEWEQVMEFPLATNDDGEPVAIPNNTLVSYQLDFGAEYRYIRVQATMTTNWRGYWHASEMNFYLDGGVDLWAKAQPAADALLAALEEAEAVTNPTRADIDKLRAAYDAFLAVYTDPIPLRNAISRAKSELSVGGGNHPGQKPETAWTALNTATDAANAWLDANLEACTKAQLTEQENKMNAALEAWDAISINGINTNTWYYIQMPNSRSCHTATEWYESGESFKDARVAARYANIDDIEDFGGTATSLAGIVTKKMYEGEADDYTYTDDMALWRFIDAGDGKYAIQNKATGCFLQPLTSSGQNPVKVQPVPGKYDVRYIGEGKFDFGIVYGYNDEGEEKETYLNIYGQGYVGAYGYGGNDDSGSAWTILTKETIANNHKQNIIIATDSMAIRGLVLPYAISLDEKEGDAQFFTDVVSIKEEEGTLDMTETFDQINAGKPFMVFNSSSAEGVLTTTVKMATSTLTWDVDNSGVIAGTLELGSEIKAGMLVPTISTDESNAMGDVWGALATIKKDQTAAPGDAWVDVTNNPSILESDVEGDETFVLDTKNGKIYNAIEIIKGEKQTNVIYNLNGQRVSAPVKGIMIINGKKVVVK